MQTISSFQIDHTRLKRGVYVSRVDMVGGKVVTTYDIRVICPLWGSSMDGAAVHTIEHLAATILRNSPLSDRVIYFGPMGCLTGFYLIFVGEPDANFAAGVVRKVFEKISRWPENECIPGTGIGECGNPYYHNINQARMIASGFLIGKWETTYPAKEAGTK